MATMFGWEAEATAAPANGTNPVVLPICLPGEPFCSPNAEITDDVAKTTCRPNEQPIGFLSLRCDPERLTATDSLPYDDELLQLGGKDPIRVPDEASFVFSGAIEAAQKLAMDLMTLTFTKAFGGDGGIADPVLFCSGAQGNAQYDCQADIPWYGRSYQEIRRISLFLMVPMFIVMTIHSIVKGSLQSMLKGALVMLPIAIFATATLTVVAQVLLNVSDDFTHYIAVKTLNQEVMKCASGSTPGVASNQDLGTDLNVAQADRANSALYGMCMRRSVAAVAADKLGFLIYPFLAILIIGGVVIYMELVLREIGVYSTAFFLPLALAAMIWPAATKMAKMMVEILLGFIFSKVFVAAALSLGIAALARMGSTVVPEPEVTNPNTSQITAASTASQSSDGGFKTLLIGSMIVITAAFVQTKVITMTPSATAKTSGQMYNPQNLWPKGQLANLVVNRVGGGLDTARRRNRGGKTFRTNGVSSRGSGAGSGGGRAGGTGGKPTGKGATSATGSSMTGNGQKNPSGSNGQKAAAPPPNAKPRTSSGSKPTARSAARPASQGPYHRPGSPKGKASAPSSAPPPPPARPSSTGKKSP